MMRAPGSARVAFAIAGDARDPAAYSGAPASLLDGLMRCGMPATLINTDLSPPLQRALVNLLTIGFVDPVELVSTTARGTSPRLAFRANKPKLLPSRELTAIRSTVAAHRLRRRHNVERIIQFGSEYRLPPGSDYVTLDDATIVQLHRSYPYDWMRAVGEPQLRRMMARQRQIFLRARACCVLNGWAARSAVEDYGVPADRVYVVGTGPNRDLHPMPRDWTSPRFLFVGKDFERKNGQRVLTAFAQLAAAHPTATLDVVGRHPSFDQHNVRGHGQLRLDRPDDVRRLSALFARATCLVMPSLLEPTGNVHAEALAAGIGSIGTSRGGVSTVIGDAGITVDPRDTAALVSAMWRFCEPDTARRFGELAQLRAPLFTWQAVAERVLRALELPGVDQLRLAEYL